MKSIFNIFRKNEAAQKTANNAFMMGDWRVSASEISNLNKGEIFVFGSNKEGQHGGGAAYYAFKHFGAEWGVGEGLTGQTYALPTMEGEQSFKEAVARFIDFAGTHTEYTFLVTAVGCGIAGYTAEQVAPWFAPTTKLENVYLPKGFWEVMQ